MTAPRSERNTSRTRQWIALLVSLGILGAIVWIAGRQFVAWRELDRGREALARDKPGEALDHLESSLAIRTTSPEGHFLAARAARRTGRPQSADEHLREAARLGWDSQEIEEQRVLLNADARDFTLVEAVLRKCANEAHPDAADAIAVLVPVYMSQFRVVEAYELSRMWIILRPSDARAWEAHADILERLRKKEDARNALRKLLDLSPDNRKARLNLVRMLLDTRQPPEEAAGHLDRLLANGGEDPAVLNLLALCREAQGRPDEAAEILDRLVARTPADAQALHHRGRLELNRGRAGAAVTYLRRSVEKDPSDPEARYTLLRALQQVGSPTEIQQAEEAWKRCDADLKRVAELGKAISSSPLDPDLRREMGELFLRNGRTEEGLRWLQSALSVKPEHAPTHRVLAEHYKQRGQHELARYHKEFIKLDRPKNEKNLMRGVNDSP